MKKKEINQVWCISPTNFFFGSFLPSSNTEKVQKRSKKFLSSTYLKKTTFDANGKLSTDTFSKGP
jgi:hypothetical protein